jgi:hypothetical protein
MKDKHTEPFVGDPADKPDQLDLRIIRGLKQLPDHEPPTTLFSSVMLAIQTRQPSWIKRVWLWSQAPRSITFTPVRWVPAIATLLIAIVLAVAFLSDQRTPKGTSPQPNLFPIVFSLKGAEARSVSVIGTFNQWNPRGYEMQWDNERKAWSLVVRLPEGRHEYSFLIDGNRVLPDPEALMKQDDGFGHQNSVLNLREENGQTI